MKIDDNKVDGFRFISSLHTTARQLFVCSEIVRKLDSKQLPKDILAQLLLEWSVRQEEFNSKYKNSNGKLSEKKRKTTALPHYLDLCQSLGLITHLNHFYSNTRLAYVLLHFVNQSGSDRTALTLAEKIFYLVQLLNVDGDGLLLVMNLLSTGPQNQKDVQEAFKHAFGKRLKVKMELAPSSVKTVLGDRYRTLNYQWQNANSYAEHLIIPRCEWLAHLGLVDLRKKGSATFYMLSHQGESLLNGIQEIEGKSGVRDINERWLVQRMYSAIDKVYPAFRIPFDELSTSDRNYLLGRTLSFAASVVRSSNSFRLPLYDTLLFTSLHTFLEHNVIVEYFSTLGALSKQFIFEGRHYIAQQSGRINEGYVTTMYV